MPTPKTTDVGKLIKFFKKDKPNWTAKRRLGAALTEARRNGADIPPPKKKGGKKK